MKSREELLLKPYIERVSRSGMVGCRQEFHDHHRNSRNVLYISRFRTFNKDDQRFQCHFLGWLLRTMYSVRIRDTLGFR